ncbi:MAG: substrate-binding domain-containing protein [Myxococcota bacterium]
MTSSKSSECANQPAAACGENHSGEGECRGVGGAKRPTIALLLDYMTLFAGGYEKAVREAFDAIAARHGVDLLCVYGRPLAPADPSYVAHNAVYSLLRRDRVDGIVALSASLSSVAGEAHVHSLLHSYRGMALCSAGLRVPEVPSVVVDNRSGIEAAISHLIHEHSARRIAFIRGPNDNVDAQVRFDAYCDALAQHGLPLDLDLVGRGDFTRRSGQREAQEIVARAGVPDAILAANDTMALGAVTGLKALGLQIPRDLLVVGFDDLEQARLADPPLASVRQPLVAIAERALQLVLDQLAGKRVSDCSLLPAQFMPRDSCGCDRGPRSRVKSFRPIEAPDLRTELSRLQRTFAEPSAHAIETARLLDGLVNEVDGHSNAFASAVEQLLAECGDDNEYHQRVQAAITTLREELRGVATPELEDRWHDARARVAFANAQSQMQRRLEHDEAYHRLIEHADRLNKALDLPSLKTALENTLPAVGVMNASISRSRAKTNELELFVGLKDGVPYRTGRGQFSVYDLFPREADASHKRRTWLIFPLAFEAQNLGVAAFEYSRHMTGWQVIRDQVSAALRSVALYDEIVENTTRHERRIQEQERASTAKRIQGLSVLAGGVAHDLNNVLGPLVALPDVILQELQALNNTPVGHDVRTDIETIRSAALRATQTIKDLLTLSRQGQAAKEPLALNRIITDCISQDALRFSREPSRRAKLEVDLFADPLCVRASPSHLTRAITNLLRNAAEAINGDGVIQIRTQRVFLARPLHGYETVEPGEYAVVTVADTGTGIAPTEIGRIFEPFFSSKKLGEDSGSGLGLAIVHGVVKEHGGFINVESTLGRGTTFTLYFPLIAAIPIASTIDAQPHATQQANILVVDDEPVQLRTARRILTLLGYQVDTLRSGVEAYQLFSKAHANVQSSNGAAQSPYDLIIADMMLGEERDGLEMLQDIARLFPDQKAIIASGHASTERTALAVSRGVLWLAKPYTSSELARAVQDALSMSASLASASPPPASGPQLSASAQSASAQSASGSSPSRRRVPAGGSSHPPSSAR